MHNFRSAATLAFPRVFHRFLVVYLVFRLVCDHRKFVHGGRNESADWCVIESLSHGICQRFGLKILIER